MDITAQKNYYKPKNKKERDARRRVWDRYVAMRDDPLRKEAETDWDNGDKVFRQWMPPREEGDWRSHISLPDGFAAIQTYLQETIDRRSRPYLDPVMESDEAKSAFCNSILNYSMDVTGFDFQIYLAKQCAAIRGTSFTMERYILEKRTIKNPTSIDKDGELVYTEKEIVDKDDTYTEFVENEFIFLDPGATQQGYLRDMVEREVLDIKEFHRLYDNKPGFMNAKLVTAGGITAQYNTAFFRMPEDMTDDEVEVLHYHNRSTDSYDAIANNVLIRMAPMPTTHKELPVSVHTYYNVPGRIYGMGIPKVIYSLTEERRSIRNLSLDRQQMNIQKMFLVNDLIDLDEEDARARPHGFIPVNTNGLPLNQTIQPLEYGDTPASAYRSEEMLLDDIRRAHGINDQLQDQNAGGTATEAAIKKEQSQRRIALINTLAEMEPMTRIGKLKWSNIQFFYPAPKVEKITEDSEERMKPVYRRVKVNGKQFEIVKNPGTGKTELKMNDVDGTTGFRLDKSYAKFLTDDYDVIVKSDPSASLSKPLRQAKTTEMFNLIALNPQLTAAIDPNKAVKRYLEINDEDPKVWMRDNGMTEADWKQLARHENMVMASGQVLSPTDGANEAHTEEHLNYTLTAEYDSLPEATQSIFQQHIMGEHQNNPNTGNVADLLGAPGSPELPSPQGGSPQEMQVADLQPATVGGGDRQDAQQEQVSL